MISSDFWVLAGTTAPVLGLTHFVVISRFSRVVDAIGRSYEAEFSRLLKLVESLNPSGNAPEQEVRDHAAKYLRQLRSGRKQLTRAAWCSVTLGWAGWMLCSSVLLLALTSLAKDRNTVAPASAATLLSIATVLLPVGAVIDGVATVAARQAEIELPT